MNLVKFNTINPIDRLFDELNRGFFSPFHGFKNGESGLAETEALRLPRTNIQENEKEFEFSMEMPGLTKKDVEVTLENDVLTVKGGLTEKKEEKNLLRREIRSTKFERSFRIGEGIEQDQIKAKMDNGVLTLTLPKKPEKVGRKVDVA